jgi:hypothetical protein
MVWQVKNIIKPILSQVQFPAGRYRVFTGIDHREMDVSGFSF